MKHIALLLAVPALIAPAAAQHKYQVTVVGTGASLQSAYRNAQQKVPYGMKVVYTSDKQENGQYVVTMICERP